LSERLKKLVESLVVKPTADAITDAAKACMGRTPFAATHAASARAEVTFRVFLSLGKKRGRKLKFHRIMFSS
jgi:hypothetical protein